MKIKEILKITNRVESIDGDDVYVLDKEMRAGLKKLKKRIKSEKENPVFLLLSNHIEFICNHADFAIAFRPVKWGVGKRWIPCLIYKHKGQWRRVILQYAKCLNCNWIGNAASPTDLDLYITMENRFEILKNMRQLSFCKCPKCGSKISTEAIWLEDAKDIDMQKTWKQIKQPRLP